MGRGWVVVRAFGQSPADRKEKEIWGGKRRVLLAVRKEARTKNGEGKRDLEKNKTALRLEVCAHVLKVVCRMMKRLREKALGMRALLCAV